MKNKNKVDDCYYIITVFQIPYILFSNVWAMKYAIIRFYFRLCSGYIDS